MKNMGIEKGEEEKKESKTEKANCKWGYTIE